MKKILSILTLAAAISVNGQTATSIANGNWTSPFTWNCTCVPTPGYNVIINHNVTLNTSFAYTSGSITVNSGGSLIEDIVSRDIWVNGGSLSNAGSLDVRYLFTQTGSISNSGTVTVRSFLNYLNFTNTGTFELIDSMYTTGNITNNGNFLNIDSITNAAIFINNGVCIYNQFTNNGPYTNNNFLSFTDITNNSTLTNIDTLICTHSGWNLGNLNNQSGAYLWINKSFLNDDVTFHDAVFNNNGKVDVLDSWYNMDTVKGTSGSFVVQDTSYNSGAFKQSFDFCDLTPPGSAPYIDFNLGSVSTAITWCNNSIAENDLLSGIIVYPNPASDLLNIKVTVTSDIKWRLLNVQGELVRSGEKTDGININDIPEGFYFLHINKEDKYIVKKIQLIK